MTLYFRFAALACFALALGLALPLKADDKAKTDPRPVVERKPIDLVLCLDVSGSMQGLIDSAKLRLWDIVNELGRLKPTPQLRVALYSYGASHYPPANGYVKKDLDLTDDLDEVYKVLNAYRIGGSVELVARVSKAALTEQKWSDKKDALKLIFVCGNESVDQDRQVTLDSVAELAKKSGVVVNTIYCGPNNAESQGWSKFAEKCGGRYTNIDMNRAAKQVVVKTEYDEQLIKLGEALNKTYVAYGKEGKAKAENQIAQDKNAESTSRGAALSRVQSKAGMLYRNSTWDLVDRMTEKDFDFSKIKEEELCDELKKIKPSERLTYLKKKAAERLELQKKISDLSAKRQKKVDEVLAKGPKTAGEKALDEALKSIVRDQAKAQGFKVEKK